MMISQQCSSSCDWSTQLRRTRAEREKLISSNDDSNGAEFLKHVRSLNEDIRDQLRSACTICCDESTTTTTQQQYKQLRSALRVALCCLSIPTENRYHDEVRRTIQPESFDCWHEELLALIMNKDMDESCRLLAAQVLCNTITDCMETAFRFMNGILPAPTDTDITQKLRNEVLVQLSTTNVNPSEASTIVSHPKSAMTYDMNWVDLILVSTTSRPLLAVVVACLHNCICSVTKESAGSTNIDHIGIIAILHKIATSTLLISTLLRHIVSAVSVKPRRNVEVTTANTATATDEATEWIVLLVSKLCRLGSLPEMYESIGGTPDRNDTCKVFPEHVVLLHSVRNTIEESRNDRIAIESSIIDVDNKSCSYCLGGENRIDIGKSIIDTHCFLADLYVMTSTARSGSQNDVFDNDTLQASVLQLVLDILAESLSEDSTISNRIRQVLGSITTVLQSIVHDLASTLDHWHIVNKNLSAREQSKMNEIDQCRITTSVRVIGNLCYHCRQNQDMLRSIIVPNKQSNTEKSERNGLHVLLSTTSMSYACFTLREWAVVAIRSVLEDCPENQAIVMQLEGQTAMQTADLEDMGIRVNLNVPTGTVTVDQLRDKK